MWRDWLIQGLPFLPIVDSQQLYVSFMIGSICIALAFGLHYKGRLVELQVALLFNAVVAIIASLFFLKFTPLGLIVAEAL